ncbi:hypothetical protein [Streptomyces anulatus]|uniref:hypothetical protein n=1 Tax=Streptomyces anulatus TaxID=1892 RepID=UPI003866B13E|nr:hypothetical protein OG865_03950 [Streptomyces anulatus]
MGDLLGLKVDTFEPFQGLWDLLQRKLAAILSSRSALGARRPVTPGRAVGGQSGCAG